MNNQRRHGIKRSRRRRQRQCWAERADTDRPSRWGLASLERSGTTTCLQCRSSGAWYDYTSEPTSVLFSKALLQNINNNQPRGWRFAKTKGVRCTNNVTGVLDYRCRLDWLQPQAATIKSRRFWIHKEEFAPRMQNRRGGMCMFNDIEWHTVACCISTEIVIFHHIHMDGCR